MTLILASKSKRRHDLLKKVGIDFDVMESNLDENSIINNNPKLYCQKLAKLKAQVILKENPNSTIIGADTIVCLNEKTLEKPRDYNEAFKMLRILSGKLHSVYTGVSILTKTKDFTFIEETKVKFLDLNDKEIANYIKKNKPYDKSGSYGIQDESMLFIDYIIGNYENVIGLPISKVYKILLELKVIK